MSLLLAAVLVVPFLSAFGTLLVRRRPWASYGISVAGGVLLVGLTGSLLWRVLHGVGYEVARIGGAPRPFGIVLLADVFSASLCAVTAVVVLVTILYSGRCPPGDPASAFHPLLHWLTMGVVGAYLTADLFNLYVWFELMLMASFVLIALGGTADQLEGALKYSVVSLLGSAVFLVAVGVAYATTGTLNMGRLAETLPTVSPGLRRTFGLLLFVAFGIKAAVFPLFFWLPASYHTAPPEVGAIFSGLLTKAGVYAMVRVDTLLIAPGEPAFSGILGAVAGLTMVGGVLGAFSQDAVRRILSFHIISQIGYLIMALALGTTFAFAALLFYLVHNVFAKMGLFLSGGILVYRSGSDHLGDIGGYWRAHPFVSLLFLVPALSLAGVPPLSGFWAKLFVVREAAVEASWVLLVAAVGTGFLTLLSMLKIWSEAYWRVAPSREVPAASPGEGRRIFATLVLGLLIVGIGLFPGGLLEVGLAAAEQLTEPEGYIRAATGGAP